MSFLIDGYLVDIAVRETHSYPSEVTSHPVEVGADVSDHVKLGPVTVTLEAVVSDTPIGAVADARVGSGLPSQTTLAFLRELRTSKRVVVVTTSLGEYADMVLSDLSLPVDATTGDALRFSVSFTQILFVSNERAIVQVSDPNAQKKRNLGAKPAQEEVTDVEDVKKHSSVWYNNSLKGSLIFD
jgi:hypothetical protein